MKKQRKNSGKKEQEEKFATENQEPMEVADEASLPPEDLAANSPKADAEAAIVAASGAEEVAVKDEAPAEPMMVDEALEATLKLMEPKAKEPEEPEVTREVAVKEFVLPDVNGPDPLGKLGAALKARREEMGISFAEITKRTCIAQSTILAMESQPLDKLDAAFYIKNRLALYASALDIDPKIIKDFFQKTVATKENDKNLPQKHLPMFWAIVGGVVIVLAILATILFF